MASNTPAPDRGYSETKDQLLKRMARLEGQVGGVARMIEEDRYCIDTLTQIAAVQAALDKVAIGLLADHVDHCVVGGAAGGEPEELSAEVMAAVARLMRRG
jgi:DNA-binding FrmR family transcriptional regulator